jgi:two-component system, OmpR family, sensor histidine kinase KdpD
MGRNIVRNRTIAAFCKNYAALGGTPALPGWQLLETDSQKIIIHPMSHEFRRKTPDELLLEVQAEDASSKGHLKIFLGYASGVGKSFRMLDEARRRRERGQDVIVGAVQLKVSPEIQKVLDTIEVMPLRKYPGGLSMNMEGILRRSPAVCIIDGLAFNNPPGLRNPTRWQDAQELVNSGIKVIGSINIQYIEELSGQVESITGKHVNETVPVSFIKSADEIEIVDAPPEEPIERSPEQQVKTKNWQQQLSLLRELTLVMAADVVDCQLSAYLEKHGIKQSFGTQEKILVCITPRANAGEMIQTARMIAEKFHAEMTVAYVKQTSLSAEDQAALEEKLALARAAEAHIEMLEGDDAIEAILDFARSHAITQLFVGHTQNTRKWPWSDPVEKLIRRSHGMDLRIFPQ